MSSGGIIAHEPLNLYDNARKTLEKHLSLVTILTDILSWSRKQKNRIQNNDLLTR